jgi:HEAT repeats
MGNDDIETLIGELDNNDFPSSDSKWQACIKLGKLNDSSKRSRIINILIKQLQPPNCAIVRAHAAEALGNLGAREALHSLLRSLTDAHHLTRAYSADALAKLGLEDCVDHLIERAEKDEHYGVRAAAINALKKICDNSHSAFCIRAKAVLWDTEKREKMKKDEEEHKQRVIREGTRIPRT